MRGYELTHARQVLRAELRRVAQEDASLKGLALDLDLLLSLCASGTNATANVLRRALLMRALADLGATQADLGRAFGASPETVTRERARPLLADAAIAEGIERQVRERLPETPEPGRVVPPAI